MSKQRDIYWIGYPYSDQDAEKHRPVLVISNTPFIATGADILVMAITSNTENPHPSVYIDTTCLDDGELKKPSLVLPHRVYTFSQQALGKYIGRLNRKCFEQAITFLSDNVGMI